MIRLFPIWLVLKQSVIGACIWGFWSLGVRGKARFLACGLVAAGLEDFLEMEAHTRMPHRFCGLQ